MKTPILYSFKRCPYAMRARMAIKLANISCEIREIKLNNKPDHMLEVSPKGTVPVLILENKIIDESNEIIKWALDQVDVFEGNLNKYELNLSEELINIFDVKFKFHLDRYKYANRYDDFSKKDHRSECMKILDELNKRISNKKWIFGKNINKLDISILPFIRQFRIADPKWFDDQTSIPNIKRILKNFFESKLLKETMINYKVWEEGSKPVYFPTLNSSD
jgi:glutathione S-transferase